MHLNQLFMFSSHDRSAERMLGVEATTEGGDTAISREGRSEARTSKREVNTFSNY